MFNPELWQSHNEYRTIVNTFGRRLSRNNSKYSFDSFDHEGQKLMALNLDPVMEFLSGFYSYCGRPAKNQVQILRSLILIVLLFNRTDAKTSLTSWVRDVLPAALPVPIAKTVTDITPIRMQNGTGTAVTKTGISVTHCIF